MIEAFKKYLEETPIEQIRLDWAKTEMFDSVGITANEFLQRMQRICPCGKVDNTKDCHCPELDFFDKQIQ